MRLYASFAREYIDRNLLATWSDPAAPPSERAAAMEQLRVLAAAFEQRAGDRTYADLLPVLTSRSDRAASMAAHREFAQAVQLVAMARFTEAAGPLARAHARLVAVSSPLALRARVEQATVAYVKQEYAEAIEIASDVASRAEQAQYVMIGIRAAWIEGMAAFNATQYGRSQAAYERMMRLASSVGDVDAWVSSSTLLANLHDRLGDAGTAWRYRVAGAARMHEVPSQSTRLNYLLSAAGDALAGNHHAAALLFQSALEAQWKNSVVQYVQVRTQRIAALHHLDRTEQAIRELQEAREHVAGVQNEFRSRVQLDLLSTEAEIYRGSDPERSVLAGRTALQLADDRTDPLRRARLQLWIADALFQLGKLDDARSAAAVGIGVLEDLRRRPSAEFSVRATDPAWRLYETAAEVAIRQGDIAAAFELSERGRARTRREAEAWDQRPPSLAALQQQLGADTAAVVLSSSPMAIRVWIVRRATVDTYEVSVDKQQLAALIASHHDELRRGAARPAESARLYRALFPARGLWAGVRHVVIVADAPLDRVAYAALWDDEAGEFLVEKAAIAMAPSVRSYMAAMERAPGARPPRTQRAALIDPVLTTGDTPEVLRALAAVCDEPVLRIGRDATPSDLAADVVSSDIVHVAAPVVANRDLPELSHLALTGDNSHESRSFLAREIAGMDEVRASVVAIEPVQAERANAREPGTLGMARALLAAGVPTIVTSLATSAARDVADTWVEFHRNYATGLGAAESLRLAQIAALRASDRQLGPWATLAVFGATR